MIVNIQKIKITVFRKNGRLAARETSFFNVTEREVLDYIGITFPHNPSFYLIQKIIKG